MDTKLTNQMINLILVINPYHDEIHHAPPPFVSLKDQYGGTELV